MESSISFAKLVKFIDSSHANDMMDGKLYCNALKYFRKTDFGGGQNDANEGIVYVDGKTITLDGNDNCIFCISMIFPQYILPDGKRGFYKFSEEVKEQFKRFGKTSYKDKDCITINNVDEFIRRVNNACEKLNVAMNHSKVEYIDRTNLPRCIWEILNMQPPFAIFIKPPEYAWQNEYRFIFYNFPPYVRRESTGAFILDIGNIRDIAHRTEHCFTE